LDGWRTIINAGLATVCARSESGLPEEELFHKQKIGSPTILQAARNAGLAEDYFARMNIVHYPYDSCNF